LSGGEWKSLSIRTNEAAAMVVRALFEGENLAALDGKRRLLYSSDPSLWDGIAFPLEIAPELAAACNLRCVMCPVPTTTRPPRLMDESVFRAVIEEAAASGERGFILLPQGFGEAFLHPKWAELVSFARSRGVRPIVLLTNAMLLHEKNAARVLDTGVDAVVVSIDGVEKETYAKLRVRGDLDVVERNVRALIEHRGSLERPKIVVRIIRMKETDAEVGRFFERWSKWLRSGDEILVNEYNDWAGRVDDRRVPGAPESEAARGPCRMPWNNLSIQADGRVSACCHDSEAELIVGDVTKGDTLRSIWNGEPLGRLRRLHREGRIEEIPICSRCRNWL
jgi:radical SAM protein with 4Fe4S-binding SPASM domain